MRRVRYCARFRHTEIFFAPDTRRLRAAYIMTCVEAAVAFIDRLEVSPELEADARGAYQSFDEQLTGAGLKRNCSRVKCLNDMFADESDLKSERLVLTPSNGNLSGMVDEDGVLRVSAGYAHQVSFFAFSVHFMQL